MPARPATGAISVEQAMSRLRKLADRKTLEGMSRYAISSEGAFGVPVEKIRAYAFGRARRAAQPGAALESSYSCNTAIARLVRDAGTGGQGPDADFMVTDFSREEPMDPATAVKVTAKPTLSARAE